MSSPANPSSPTTTLASSSSTSLILPTPAAPADSTKIDAQARQISKAAQELSTAAENIIQWSAAKVQHNIQNVCKDQFQVVEDVAAKLAAARAREVAKNGEQMLNDVDELKRSVTAMRSILQDAQKVNRQLDGLEGLLDVMEGQGHFHQQQHHQQDQHHQHQQQQRPQQKS